MQTNVTNAVHTVSYIGPGSHSESCVPSGLDFEAAGGFVARSYLSNYLLQGHRVVVNKKWAVFHG